MSNKTELQSNNIDLRAILATVNALPEAGEGVEAVIEGLTVTANGTYEAPSGVDGYSPVVVNVPSEKPTLQSKTVSPSTSSQTVEPDSGYDGLSKVTVNAMPTATQATPSIGVSDAGLITASATQAEGYVAAGTKSATKQLATQAEKTVTPSASNQTAVASGVYTTGAVIVEGDANLQSSNIKSGVSIFGVAGSVTEGENLDNAISAQDSLISQIQTALQGKATGGGGGVETCTVTVDNSIMGYADFHMVYTAFSNGGVRTVDVSSTGEDEFVLADVMVGSKIVFCCGFDATSIGMNLVMNTDYIGDVSYDKVIASFVYRTSYAEIYAVNVAGSGTIAIQ